MIRPEELTNPEARACFFRVQSRLIARGEWRPEFVIGLEPLAEQCASYMEYASSLRARELRRLGSIDPDEVKAVEKICDEIVEETRLLARKFLADFLMIPANRVPFAVMNAEGLDADIADLCAPFEPDGALLENDR